LARELEEVQRAVEEATGAQAAAQGAAQAAAQAAGRDAVGVTTTPDGRIRIVPRDGGPVIEIDRSLFRPDQIEEMVQTALEPPDPPELPDRGPPDGVIQLVGIVMFFLTCMVVLGPLARAWARRLDRRTQGGAAPADVAQRLDRIEQGVDAVAVEVERVAEAQRFSARLLSERLPDALPQLDAAARARAQG
jgi:hypothetical protein